MRWQRRKRFKTLLVRKNMNLKLAPYRYISLRYWRCVVIGGIIAISDYTQYFMIEPYLTDKAGPESRQTESHDAGLF